MRKPKTSYPIRLTFLGSDFDYMAVYGATSQTVLGVSYRVFIATDGDCRCTCPGHCRTWTDRARAAGSRVCLTDPRWWCPHIRAVVAQLYRDGIIRAVLLTPCGELELNGEVPVQEPAKVRAA